MHDKNMKTEYTITEIDYVNSMKLFSRITSRTMVLYVIALVMLGLVAVYGSPVLKSGAIGGLIGGFVVIFLVRFVINPVLSRRHYRKYKAIQEPLFIQLMEEGVQFSNFDGEGFLRWEKIHKWRQNERYVLIYPMPCIYHIIPKTTGESGFDLGALIKALEDKVGAET